VVLQVGDPVTVYEKPATRFVADFIGESNFLKATVSSVERGKVEVVVGSDRVYAETSQAPLASGQQVTLTVRPEKLNLVRPTEANGVGAGRRGARGGLYRTDTRFVVALPSGETVVARLQEHRREGTGRVSRGR